MTPDVLNDEHRQHLEAAGWREMASHGWRRTDNGNSEYIQPFTARIIAEWWIARALPPVVTP